jgi:hypothetical protein
MKRLVLVLLTSLIAAPLTTRAESGELGTLFFTPAERNAMDRLRRGENIAPSENIASGASADPVINGYIRRSDGVNTVWINGAPFKADAQRLEQIDGLPIGTTARVEIRSGVAGAAVLAPRKVKSKPRR